MSALLSQSVLQTKEMTATASYDDSLTFVLSEALRFANAFATLWLCGRFVMLWDGGARSEKTFSRQESTSGKRYIR